MTESNERGRCLASKADGERCKMLASSDSGFCLWHDPDRTAEADAARDRGRMSRRKPVVTLDELEPALAESPDLEVTLDGLSFYLGWALRQCAGGRLDADRLRSITQAVTGLRTSLTARELARQVREAQREIKKLKGELAKREQAREPWR